MKGGGEREREIKETTPFTIVTKKNEIKYLGINLPKDTKVIYRKV